MTIQRRHGRIALVTGAAGGIGRACARLLGMTHDLLLTDREGTSLRAFADDLAMEGHTIAGVLPGDLLDDATVDALSAQAGGTPLTLAHTAGLSPAMADWREIMLVNLVATERLLRALDPLATQGSVAVLISSAAGYRIEPSREARQILSDPLAPGFLDAIGGVVSALATDRPGGKRGVGYSLSKFAVHRICERRAVSWASRGARIASVSPGLTLTPMGRREIAQTTGGIGFPVTAPLGRTATALDIAQAVDFLASDRASFITGCDLRVDGGSIPATVLAGT